MMPAAKKSWVFQRVFCIFVTKRHANSSLIAELTSFLAWLLPRVQGISHTHKFYQINAAIFYSCYQMPAYSSISCNCPVTSDQVPILHNLDKSQPIPRYPAPALQGYAILTSWKICLHLRLGCLSAQRLTGGLISCRDNLFQRTFSKDPQQTPKV